MEPGVGRGLGGGGLVASGGADLYEETVREFGDKGLVDLTLAGISGTGPATRRRPVRDRAVQKGSVQDRDNPVATRRMSRSCRSRSGRAPATEGAALILLDGKA